LRFGWLRIKTSRHHVSPIFTLFPKLGIAEDAAHLILPQCRSLTAYLRSFDNRQARKYGFVSFDKTK
jgi:hypothetical protein